jgi:transcriptional regulator with XRE-family HTH domain
MRDLREDHDLSQADVAAYLKVAKPRISEWENGKYTPSVETIISLAALYNVSTDYLLGLSDDPARRA